MDIPAPTVEQALALHKIVPRILAREAAGEFDRRLDQQVGEALGWRVSRDEWWNWHPGPVYDPPGDEWCIRRDGRSDKPCNEALPHFRAQDVMVLIDRAAMDQVRPRED